VRVRFRFTKLGKIRFTSHRDVARIWERAMRRAALPVALTEGFSPRPKVHFGLALSTGYESMGEYIDVDFRDGPGESDAIDLAALPQRLSQMLPTGLTVEAAEVIDRREPSLQQAVTSCTWSIELPGVEVEEARRQARRLLDAEHLEVTRERKGQPVLDDIRPAIIDLTVDGGAGGTTMMARLGTQPRSVRPAELLGAFDPSMPDAILLGGRVCRLQQWITADGARREPLAPPSATSASHAQVRAS
jgi:radical SAM-linked protein